MKKKYIVLTIVIAVIALLITLFIFFMNSKNEEMIKFKGYLFFGNSYCESHTISKGGDAISNWKCKLCSEEDDSSTTNVPSICFKCSKITGRCTECGKLLKVETM